MKNIKIKYILATVLFLAAGTAIIYAYASYNECRCAQSSPGITNEAATCCPLSATYRSNFSNNCCKNLSGAWVSGTPDSSGNCPVTCGWVKNGTRQNVTVYCVSQQGNSSCYIENSVTKSYDNLGTCDLAHKGATNYVVGGGNNNCGSTGQNSGCSCQPSGSQGSGGVICPGAQTGWNDPYICQCS
ncbi:MAG: hypothetical protein LBI01_04925 [Elusimicrobium sp.]|nr:hypothetical protein [Elusimicrobium sp.]